jgi:hypothetical protein
MPRKKTFTPFMHDNRPKTNDVLKCLLFEPQWLSLLYSMNKPYEKLLPVLEELSASDSFKISIKSISENINESNHKVSRWIHSIYEDLYILNQDKPELFRAPGYQYDLCFRAKHYESAYFSLWLDRPLSRSDCFEFSFIKVKIPYSMFWVHNIYHNYTNCSLVTYAELSDESPNPYLDFIRSREKFQEDVAFYRRVYDDVSNFSEVLEFNFGITHLPKSEF